MLEKVKPKLERFCTILWFETVCIVFGILSLQALFLYYDHHGINLTGISNFSLNTIRSFTTVIATSTATIASIVFSLTVVSLMNIASNLSLRYVMKVFNDRTFRIVLGIYIATFLYACLFLLFIDQSNDNIPNNTVLFLVLLLVMCIVALVIHFRYIMASIQVDNICKTNAKAIIVKLKLIMNPVTEPDRSDGVKKKTIVKNNSENVACDTSGYITLIDYQNLFSIASSQNLYIRVCQEENMFILAPTPLCEVHSSHAIEAATIDKIRSCFTVKPEKNGSDSVDFKMTYLTDIIMKTLSPGINDTNSALVVVDHISAIFLQIFEMGTPRKCFYDKNGYFRLEISPFNIENFMTRSIKTIANASNGNMMFYTHLINDMAKMATVAKQQGQKKLLCKLVELIKSFVKEIDMDKENNKEFNEALGKFDENLDKKLGDPK